MNNRSVAVVLLQLGGPDSPDAVKPFLYNLFCDEDIIDFPGAFLARKFLAKVISSRRSKPIREHYEEIGGKSPINELTHLQAGALEKALQISSASIAVHIAMRYWHPMTESVVRQIKKDRNDLIILLPLYPQFSRATTFSSLNEWKRQATNYGIDHIETRIVCCYPEHPSLIDAFVDRINDGLKKFQEINPTDIDLVFSAHGVPVSFIEKGDPYQLQVECTVREVLNRGKWKSPTVLCYQSKVGPQRWIGPSLVDTINALAHKGRKHILVIPIAFVTEHIETLHEINIEVREEAEHLGVEQFETMKALNDHPLFIQCLKDLVLSTIQSGENVDSKCKRFADSNRSKHFPVLCPRYEAKK